MSRLGSAVTGVAVSAAIAAGGYAGEMNKRDNDFNALLHCRQELGGQALNACLADARELYGGGSLPMGILEIAGALGVVLNGYIGYKAVKKDNRTTGVVEDF
jgi:hypothetical protein